MLTNRRARPHIPRSSRRLVGADRGLRNVAEPSWRRAEGTRLLSHDLKMAANDGATLTATGCPEATSSRTLSRSLRKLLAFCGHSRMHVPQAMQRSSST